jgi:hypothetical protein
MNVTYTERAKNPSETFALLQQATQKLDDVVGRSSATLSAEWDRTEDTKGRPWYTLHITDFADSAQTSFAPDHLKPSYDLQFRLYRLWDHLLQARGERLLQELNQGEE